VEVAKAIRPNRQARRLGMPGTADAVAIALAAPNGPASRRPKSTGGGRVDPDAAGRPPWRHQGPHPGRQPTSPQPHQLREQLAKLATAYHENPVGLAMALLRTLTRAHGRFYVDQPCVQADHLGRYHRREARMAYRVLEASLTPRSLPDMASASRCGPVPHCGGAKVTVKLRPKIGLGVGSARHRPGTPAS
jgi:hypothetical protein